MLNFLPTVPSACTGKGQSSYLILLVRASSLGGPFSLWSWVPAHLSSTPLLSPRGALVIPTGNEARPQESCVPPYVTLQCQKTLRTPVLLVVILIFLVGLPPSYQINTHEAVFLLTNA